MQTILTDVQPDGRSMLVTNGVQRMRWRSSNTVPVAMVPGAVYGITIDMWYTSYIFEAGHRIRLLVSSSNTPRYGVSRNNGYCDARKLHGCRPALAHVLAGGPNSGQWTAILPAHSLPVEDEDSLPAFVASNSVHVAAEYPSRLELPIVPLSAIPDNYEPGIGLPDLPEFRELAYLLGAADIADEQQLLSTILHRRPS